MFALRLSVVGLAVSCAFAIGATFAGAATLRGSDDQPYTGPVTATLASDVVVAFPNNATLTCTQSQVTGQVSDAGSVANSPAGAFNTAEWNNGGSCALTNNPGTTHLSMLASGFPWTWNMIWLSDNTTGSPNGQLNISGMSGTNTFNTPGGTVVCPWSAVGQTQASIFNPDNTVSGDTELGLVDQPFSTTNPAQCVDGTMTATYELTGQDGDLQLRGDPGAVSHTLAVVKSGLGKGTVTSSPAGITCAGDCSQAFPHGTVVTLIAGPDGLSTFQGWFGAGCSGTAACQVTLNSDETVTAAFDRFPPTVVGPPKKCKKKAQGVKKKHCKKKGNKGKRVQKFGLRLLKEGKGVGTIDSQPAGIHCRPDCTQNYKAGTKVRLTAMPDEFSEFAHWSGDCSGHGSSQRKCVVTMTEARSATATFNRRPCVGITCYSVTTEPNAEPGFLGAGLAYTGA